jgi:hypothetical protein
MPKEDSVPIDQAKVGEVAARLMEKLEHEFGKDESAEIGSVFLIAAVRHDESRRVTVHYDTSSGTAPHEGIGLLQYVQELICKEDSSRKP